MTGYDTMRAGYLFDRSLSDRDGTERMLANAAAAGVDTLITKAASVTPWLIRACSRLGVTVLGSVPCLSDHNGPPSPHHERLRPVGADGAWAPMEWYTGLIPTDREHNLDLAARCAALATTTGLGGLVLDFLRWPLHWELELRAHATPRASSFDPATLADFTRRTGRRLPGEPVAAARLLLGELAGQWHDYRCSVIEDLTAELRAAVRAAAPHLPVGMFLVPAPHHRRRETVGQDVTALSGHVDGFLVMTYHGIQGREPSWIAEITADIRRHSTVPVVPMVQTTASPDVARGADWGMPLGSDDLGRALGYAAGQVCLFPLEGMDRQRWQVAESTWREPVLKEQM